MLISSNLRLQFTPLEFPQCNHLIGFWLLSKDCTKNGSKQMEELARKGQSKKYCMQLEECKENHIYSQNPGLKDRSQKVLEVRRNSWNGSEAKF